MTRSGIAVDLGTTTVSVARVSLSDGLVLATAEARNAQAQDYGRDILSRLSAAMAGERDRLRDLAQSQVIELMGQEPAERIVAAGNSVMAALFVGADVSGLATAPFAPVRGLRCEEGPLAELMDPQCITVLEPLDAFVGGDIRAGLIAAGMTAGSADPRLFIDLGTNAEIVLAKGRELFVCSAPAGPAFEGGGFKLVGSQILADVADLLRRGVLGRDGKLGDQAERDQSGVAYVVGKSSQQAISQRSIRDLQLAKAATATAMAQVLKAAALQPEDVAQIDIAGAFGSALDPGDLVTLGLIPESWQDRTRSLGNASLAGALAILDGASPDLGPGTTLVPVTLPDDPDFNAKLIAATDFRWLA